MSIEISDAIWKTAEEVLQSKRAALAAGDEAVSAQIGEGKDIISVLRVSKLSHLLRTMMLTFTVVRSQMSAAEEDKMSDKELLGHMSSVIFVSF